MDDDSGLGCLAGVFFVLILLAAVIRIIIIVLTAIVTAMMILVGIALAVAFFLATGVGTNLLVRVGIGLVAKRPASKVTTSMVRWGLAAVYAAPWLLLLIGIPVLGARGLAGQIIWLGALFLSVPAYYWTWWDGHLKSFPIHFNGPLQPPTNTPEMDFRVPFQFDITMQAEERIIFADLRAREILGAFQLQLWLLDLRARIKRWWQTVSEEVEHGNVQR